ncbi:uncharacterized protein LOC119455998 [Dermacentor silvarum]|uniref:uncharacterized protein LOC119455998 n=1 Tax=Dermacentor silvarum TaxID=543639 RepID=UPI001897D273|nr:uncharacterized protein LOC119455998 [Dermacentor silvarum]
MALSTTRTMAGRVGSIAFYHPYGVLLADGTSFGALLLLNIDLCFRLRPTSRMSIVLLHVCHPPNVPIGDGPEHHLYRGRPRSIAGMQSCWLTRLLIALHCYVIPTSAFDCGLRVGRTSVCRSLPSSQGLENHSHRGRPCLLDCIPSPMVSCRQTGLAPTTDVRFRWRCTRTIQAVFPKDEITLSSNRSMAVHLSILADNCGHRSLSVATNRGPAKQPLVTASFFLRDELKCSPSKIDARCSPSWRGWRTLLSCQLSAAVFENYVSLD